MNNDKIMSMKIRGNCDSQKDRHNAKAKAREKVPRKLVVSLVLRKYRIGTQSCYVVKAKLVRLRDVPPHKETGLSDKRVPGQVFTSAFSSLSGGARNARMRNVVTDVIS